MSAFETVAALVSVVALFAYVNHRVFKQPPAIALMMMSLLASLLFILLERLGWLHLTPFATRMLDRLALSETLLHGMLGILLFAGALHVNVSDLREQKLAIGALSIGGTVLSTLTIGGLAFVALPIVGLRMPLGHCMLFGALISPTDPIAVLGILKRAGIPRSMEIQIAGESLFNDGIGVVVFLTVLDIMTLGQMTFRSVLLLFLREAVGGAAFGLVTGYITYRLLKSIDHYQTELLITIALVLGGYALAERLHLSAPIAAVVAGLLIGNQGRWFGMSDVTRDHLDNFWSLIDEILNSVLFVLVGFEVLRLTLNGRVIAAGAMMVAVILLARLASVFVPVIALSKLVRFARGSVAVLTWGGLRGGISVALALSLPDGPTRDLIVAMTYLVVVFSVIVQGATLGRLARRYSVA